MFHESNPLSSTQHPYTHEQQERPAAASRRWNPLRWWYRLSVPGAEGDDSQEDVLSRSKLASILLLITLIGVIAFVPAALTSDDLHVVPPVIGLFVMACLGVVLNKCGKTAAAGILIVASLDAALIFSLLSYPHFTLTETLERVLAAARERHAVSGTAARDLRASDEEK